ncbi:hypothetical protein [Capnocytophaga sp.]|uniref:hypothetical protein n=1 Tax=Capnocytophaga sp. TaxID=44737 RepID=UPI0026DDB1BE|nr:hypothetical protein [Capnocytophaga sp.]MDO5105464.1 hypothetical protein [Capnocytophaga sp.]
MKKRNLLTFIAFAVTIILNAQDIKVKKGELLLDKKPVARVEKVDKKYQFSDLSGNVMFSAIITQQTVLGNYTSERWLQLIGNNGVVKELELPGKLTFTFSNEKYNIDAVLKSEQNLLTVNGIDKASVDTFFQNEDKPFSDKWDAIFEKEKAVIKQEDELAATDKITIDSKGNILKKDQKIGTISFTSETGKAPGSLTMSTYKVKDLSGGVIASSNFNNMTTDYYSVKTYDQKKIEIFAPTSKQYTSMGIDRDDLAKRIVYRLYASGYPFGDMTEVYKKYIADANQKVMDENKEREDQAKSASLNIYETPGYLIDKNGKKLEGFITIEFESIDKKLGREKNVSNLTSYGNSVSIKISGEKKIKYHKAKDGVKFCIGNRCFLGTKSEEDGAFGHGGSQLDALSGGSSQFFEVLYEKDGNYVLAHVKYPEEYYIKLRGKEKAVYLGYEATFGKKSADKVEKIFNKYINCTSLNFVDYDTKSKESVIQIVEDYMKSCQ